jgi:hypothetical protein
MMASVSESDRYWLSHSEGFRVDAPGGRVGIVEAVLEREPGAVEALLVRAGVLGRKLLVVPAREVERVAPRRQQVLLGDSPEVGVDRFLGSLRCRGGAHQHDGQPGRLG